MAFADALRIEMKRHGDTYASLFRAICWQDNIIDRHTIRPWCDGRRAPRTIQSFEALNRIERRYRLPVGYFKARLLHIGRAPTGPRMAGVPASRARRLACHLPEDFNLRSRADEA